MEHVEQDLVGQVADELRLLEQAGEAFAVSFPGAQEPQDHEDDEDEPDVSVEEEEPEPGPAPLQTFPSDAKKTLAVLVQALDRLTESMRQVHSLAADLLEAVGGSDDAVP